MVDISLKNENCSKNNENKQNQKYILCMIHFNIIWNLYIDI